MIAAHVCVVEPGIFQILAPRGVDPHSSARCVPGPFLGMTLLGLRVQFVMKLNSNVAPVNPDHVIFDI